METSEPAARHLLIAGTGRAGTSLLVRWLTALGLDTHITRYGEGQWHADANAGFEDLPFNAPPGTLPYVVKTPWLSTFIDELLARRDFAIDVVVVPVRDLAEAAMSRVVIERQAISRAAPWLGEAGLGWPIWSGAPGGVLYSLHPLDQARVLAQEFHHLVQRLVAAGIPVVFLDFPRMAEDARYLFAALRPWLPEGTEEAAALAAHARLVDPAKLRAGEETTGHPQHGVLAAEAAALRRELAVQRAARAARDAEAAQLRARLEQATAEAASAVAAAREAEARAVRDATALVQAREAAARLQAEIAQGAATHDAALAEMRASSSWRLTAPLRALARVLRG